MTELWTKMHAIVKRFYHWAIPNLKLVPNTVYLFNQLLSYLSNNTVPIDMASPWNTGITIN